MADDPTKEALRRITKANGAADWHHSTKYKDDDVTQVVSIRPAYDADTQPSAGNVTVHILHADEEHFGEAEVTVSSQEMERLCRLYLATLEADEEHFDKHHPDEDEEEEEEDDDAGDETEEEDEEAGDEGDGDDNEESEEEDGSD